MQIQNTEELEGLAVGVEVRVQSNPRTWRRVPNGFASETDVLGTRFFAGYVQQGLVYTVDPQLPSLAGDWWTFNQNRYTYLHLRTLEDGRHVVAVWYRNQFRSTTEVAARYFAQNQETIHRIAEPPNSLVTNSVALREIVRHMAAAIPNPKE